MQNTTLKKVIENLKKENSSPKDSGMIDNMNPMVMGDPMAWEKMYNKLFWEHKIYTSKFNERLEGTLAVGLFTRYIPYRNGKPVDGKARRCFIVEARFSKG